MHIYDEISRIKSETHREALSAWFLTICIFNLIEQNQNPKNVQYPVLPTLWWFSVTRLSLKVT